MRGKLVSRIAWALDWLGVVAVVPVLLAIACEGGGSGPEPEAVPLVLGAYFLQSVDGVALRATVVDTGGWRDEIATSTLSLHQRSGYYEASLNTVYVRTSPTGVQTVVRREDSLTPEMLGPDSLEIRGLSYATGIARRVSANELVVVSPDSALHGARVWRYRR